MKKKIAAALLVLLILPFICSLDHTDEFYVNDYAGVLAETQEKRIVEAAVALEKATGAQIVILTVESLDGKTVNEYAIDVARDWGIGDKDKNNGVLILVSMEGGVGNRDVKVDVGYGLEGRLNDGKVGALIEENAIPYYKEDDFANGTEQLFWAVLNEVRAEYELEAVGIPDAADEYKDAQEWEEPQQSPWVMVVAIIAFVIFFIVRMQLARRGIFILGGFGGFGGGYRGGGFGGGGFGGGGGHRGGGGSFGGGGAGRKF